MSDIEITMLVFLGIAFCIFIVWAGYQSGYSSGHGDCFLEELKERSEARQKDIEKAAEKAELKQAILLEIQELLPKSKK